ncbi:PAS domain S-box protein [Paenibacillus sp. CGMCC 1.16610]|uniref:PAS domain-containing protein n=1 Tax=Paenibacillus anseongense TaxID=2682845 RepID=A0ABW9U771_9BACL|nr:MULTISPECIES: MHYT domain-containing protein [Paenibacillus]MBA2942101.1 PAS domain S-box protein [Paenibacillus sp. CGMCC 1.16610]MVQ35934.1 PAS domain-containing protein [Paenibacillus anseongense]
MHLAEAHPYNLYLILLAFVVVLSASCTSLKLTKRITDSSPWQQKLWILRCASTLAAGIWSMHFIAILACPYPSVKSFDMITLFTSLAIAIIGSIIGFTVMHFAAFEFPKFLLGGTFMGLSIAGMHFMNMSALKQVEIRYAPFPFILTILLAIIASITALYLSTYAKQKVVTSSFVISLTLTGMHYLGMSAGKMTYPDSSMLAEHYRTSMDSYVLALLIAFGTIIFFSINLFYSMKIDQKVAEQFALKASLLDTSIDSIMVFNSRGWIIDCNPAASAAFGYTHKQALSLTVFDFLFPFDRNGEAAASLFQQLSRQDAALLGKRMEMAAYRADRSEFPAEITITGFQFKGKMIFAATIRDITNQKRSASASAS